MRKKFLASSVFSLFLYSLLHASTISLGGAGGGGDLRYKEVHPGTGMVYCKCLTAGKKCRCIYEY